MAKHVHPKILTANDLIEGSSVFLSAGGWKPRIDSAIVAVNGDQAEELEALGKCSVQANAIVGPYLVDVSLEAGTPVPVSRREQIRATGVPTIPVGLAA